MNHPTVHPDAVCKLFRQSLGPQGFAAGDSGGSFSRPEESQTRHGRGNGSASMQSARRSPAGAQDLGQLGLRIHRSPSGHGENPWM